LSDFKNPINKMPKIPHPALSGFGMTRVFLLRRRRRHGLCPCLLLPKTHTINVIPNGVRNLKDVLIFV
jgi:hypothetical protein